MTAFRGKQAWNSGSSKLFLGFEADFLDNIDMSVFDCLTTSAKQTVLEEKVSVDVSAKDSESPAQNKKCLSLQKRRPLSNVANQSQYASPCTEEEMQQAAKGVVLVNTECNDRWALRTFMEWAEN